MSAHAVIWLLLYLYFAMRTLSRPAWGIPLYLMTFFASPVLWWWGGPLAAVGERWSLLSSLILLAGVGFSGFRISELTKAQSRVMLLLVAYAINATFVHLIFSSSSDPEESWKWLDLMWKQVVLLLLMIISVRDIKDFQILSYTLLIGGAFIACEVYFFKAGSYHHGRLEGLPLPSGGSSNFVSPVLSQSAIIGGFLVFFGKTKEKLFALFCCVMLTEAILQCLSRGGLLGLLLGAAWLILQSKGKVRRHGMAALVIAAMGALVIMGPEQQEKVFGRFSTTFAEQEERDIAAESRLILWQSTFDMIKDRPLGSGGNAFKSHLGQTYIPIEWQNTFRASQNGFLDTAASWGVQGLAIFLAALATSWFAVRKTVAAAHRRGDVRTAFLGGCIDATLVMFLVTTVFISGLRGEWFFWWHALALGFSVVYSDEAMRATEHGREDNILEGDDPAVDRINVSNLSMANT